MRDEFSDAYTNAVDGLGPLIASGDGQTIAEALESSAAEFAGYLEDWDELDPPPQATETHSRQTALIAEVAGIFSDLVEPVRAEDDQATSAVASRMETFISNVGEASQAWNRLMVEGLRG